MTINVFLQGRRSFIYLLICVLFKDFFVGRLVFFWGEGCTEMCVYLEALELRSE